MSCMWARTACFRAAAKKLLLVSWVLGSINAEGQQAVTSNAPTATSHSLTNVTSNVGSSVAATTNTQVTTQSVAAATNDVEPSVTPTTNAQVTPKAVSAESLQIKRGFRIETVASAPMVSNPLALAFDENGRLFVVEGAGPGPSLQGRITVLTADAEGVFKDTARYADNVPWASALACYDGGLFVAAGREILFLKESQRNSGVADTRRVVFADFGATNRPLAADALLNSFQWGLDNRIHLGTADLGGQVRSVASGADTLNVAGFDLSFDPRTLRLQVEPGTAQSGLTFDDYGRKYVSNFDRPLRTPIFGVRYMARNPFAPAPEPLLDVALPATPVFRLAPASAKPNEPAGRSNITVSTWLTQARGSVVYRGNIFPTNYLGNVFIADPGAHLIHRSLLLQTTLYPQAVRDRADAGTEFVASSNDVFRPMQIVNGPDGTLYVADAGKATGEGKIYRIAPEGFKPGPMPRPGSSNSAALVAMLGHRNGWHRDTAARLLYQRQDPASRPLLSNVVNSARSPLARLHALHSLEGFGALKEAQLLRLLRDQDEHVRAEAVCLLGELALAKKLSDSAPAQIRGLVQDRSMLVQQQLALSLGDMQRPGKAAVIAELVARDIGMPWFTNAALTSVTGDGGELFSLLARNPRFRTTAAGQNFIVGLSTIVGLAGPVEQVRMVMDTLNRGVLDSTTSYALLAALGDGLKRSGQSLAGADSTSTLANAYAQTLDNALNQNAPPGLRVQAIRILGVSPYTFADVGDWLFALAAPTEVPAVELAAIQGLGTYKEPRIYRDLLQLWPQLSAPARRTATAALLGRVERARPMLVAIETGRIKAAEVSPLWVNYLRTHADPAVSTLALRVLGPVPSSRPEVLKAFEPALRLNGVASNGRQTFIARCVGCHRLAADGQTLGPDLNGVKAKGKEQALIDIIEPDRGIAPEDSTYVLQSKTGEVFLGSVQGSNETTVTLREGNRNLLVWPWTNVVSLQSRPWSLMPYGLEQGLTAQNMADLLAFLMSH